MVASKFPFGKKGFKYFVGYKGAKNRKVHIEKTLMKLNLCIFFFDKKMMNYKAHIIRLGKIKNIIILRNS